MVRLVRVVVAARWSRGAASVRSADAWRATGVAWARWAEAGRAAAGALEGKSGWAKSDEGAAGGRSGAGWRRRGPLRPAIAGPDGSDGSAAAA